MGKVYRFWPPRLAALSFLCGKWRFNTQKCENQSGERQASLKASLLIHIQEPLVSTLTSRSAYVIEEKKLEVNEDQALPGMTPLREENENRSSKSEEKNKTKPDIESERLSTVEDMSKVEVAMEKVVRKYGKRFSLHLYALMKQVCLTLKCIRGGVHLDP